MKKILWFRRDFRIEDNLILSYGGEVLPIFIFDTQILQDLSKEDKRLSLIFTYVLELKERLKAKDLDLKIFYADPLDLFSKLVEEGYSEVLASGDYDSYAKERDRAVSHKLRFRYLHDTYIFRPDEVLKEDKTPYLVFTPFYKKARQLLENKDLSASVFSPSKLQKSSFETITALAKDGTSKELPIALESIGFKAQDLKVKPAHKLLENFLPKLQEYTQKRDYLNEEATSALSVALRFGTISVREILRQVLPLRESESFVRQLIFRDFYASMLFHFPSMQTHNYKYTFNGIQDLDRFERFCEAKTGVPIVDAGVKELLCSGNMHNRVRMIVASFFTKDLLLPWQWGESFFAMHLLDYDAASNILSWQWSAGTGVDPQPYFRVFNPYLQSKKFDKDALYIKKHLPQLAHIEAKQLHNEEYLLHTDIANYVKPIVVHKEAAKQAIESFKQEMRE